MTRSTETQAPTNRSRAQFFAALVSAAAATAAAPAEAPAQTQYRDPLRRLNDADILNFALNLEYLEAEYYLRAVMGQTLDEAVGAPLGGAVRGGRRVTFGNGVRRGFAEDIARNELAHVLFLRSALGARAIERPVIDFDAGFHAVAQAAGLDGFDPFADEQSFFIGAYLFEDVGVTAYKGAANMIHDRHILTSAAGILAAEAYHAGVIRSVLYKMGERGVTASRAISGVRDSLDGPDPIDQPVAMDGRINLVPADPDGIAFGRTTRQVHNIVFANPAPGVTRGGFFPEGTNGRLVTS